MTTRDISPAPRPDSASERLSAWRWTGLGIAALLAACAAPVPPPPPPPPPPPAPVPAPPPPPPVSRPAAPRDSSTAASPQDYRKDGARHIYARNGHRIYKGQLPPLLHAVGVLQVEVDGSGNVSRMNWMRAPSHAPDVMREIERTVRAAAPFPAPVRMGQVTYTDVWLWDKSGQFQLDTLTEGQRSK